MADEPRGAVTHAEQRELDALRRRAYGPDADILGDAQALSRLRDLEELVRAPTRDSPHDAVVPHEASASRRTPRRHAGLIAGAVAAAIVFAAIVWSAVRGAPTHPVSAGPAQTAVSAIERGEVRDQRHLDDLRDEVLALPGSEAIANRMIRDQLRPHGILYGRVVGSGPTIDDEFCMIIADLPASSIRCVSVASASPVSVTIPSWYSDSESDLFTGLGELVSYTLLPGGGVVAVPADSLDVP